MLNEFFSVFTIHFHVFPQKNFNLCRKIKNGGNNGLLYICVCVVCVVYVSLSLCVSDTVYSYVL